MKRSLVLLFLWNDLSSFHNSLVENRNHFDLKDLFGTNIGNIHSKGGGIEYHGHLTGFNFLDCSDISDVFLYLLTTEGSRKRNPITTTNTYF